MQGIVSSPPSDTTPSDTIKTRLLESNLPVENVHRRRSVHFHVEVIGSYRNLLEKLVDEDTSLDLGRSVSRWHGPGRVAGTMEEVTDRAVERDVVVSV